LIERVTYFNEENGFAVLQVKVKGFRDLVTVVGSLPCVSAGEWLHAEGMWIQDREYGRQFRARLLTSSPPTSLEGIEKYLGSGMVKGIGPVYARKLVGKFGERILEVIDGASARLEEIDGIGPKRRRRIKDAWAEQKVVREIMVFLHSHGVSTSRAVRIHKLYGAEAVERVRENPYALAKDVAGIGFATADRIARDLGIPADSLARAAAGLDHLLLQATQEGHCCLPVEELAEAAVKLLEVGEARVREALEQALRRRELVLETIDGTACVFLPALLKAEQGIADRIARLALAPSAYPPIDATRALAWWHTRHRQALSASQAAALEMALQHRLLIVTGGPGVGKTTLLRAVLGILMPKRVKPILCAPTGRAAQRLGEATGLTALTIHRLLEAGGGAGGSFARNAHRPLEGDLLVVDECSMVDVPLMHALLSAMPPQAHLLLVGDADQLPSVGPGNVLRDLIGSGQVPVARLTEVFRQAGASQIVQAAHRINTGQMPQFGKKGEESDCFFIERPEPEEISAMLLELVRERIPQRFGFDAIRDVQVLSPMNRGSLGIRALNELLQNTLNPARADAAGITRFGTQFRVGDKVLQTENNYDKGVYNGDIGRIARIEEIDQEVVVRYDEREVGYDFGELDELTLAYAITIHKSQGSEFPVVVVPLAMQQYVLLQRNLIYTAITRGKRLVVLVGQKQALGLAVRTADSRRRYTGLTHWLRCAGQLAADTGAAG